MNLLHPTPAKPAAERPLPDYYRVLGLAPFETNPDVISARVRDLLREARKYQIGPYAAQTQTRLDELADASACLLDPWRKLKYDDDLRRRYQLPPVTVASTFGPLQATARTRPPSPAPRRGFPPGLALVLLVSVMTATIVGGVHLLKPPVTEQSTADADVGHRGLRSPKKPGSAVVADSLPIDEASARDRGSSSHDRKMASGPGDASETPPLVAAAQDEDSAGGAAGRKIPTDDLVLDENESLQEAVQVVKQIANELGIEPPPPPPREPTDKRRDWRPVRPPDRHPPAPEFNLSFPDVLSELKDFRLLKKPDLRVARHRSPHNMRRILDLVRYARQEFGDDPRLMPQLRREVKALQRLYPQARDLLEKAMEDASH